MKRSLVLGLLILVFSVSCGDIENPTESRMPSFRKNVIVQIDSDYEVAAGLSIWKDNKKAAYTITFDDTRTSHFRVAAPALQEKGLPATFFLDTKDNTTWRQWQQLYLDGHEIGSHTRNHLQSTTLTEDVFVAIRRWVLPFDFAADRFDLNGP